MAAYRIAREVANEGEALVSITLSETMSYKAGKGKEVVQPDFEKQLQFFKDEGCDSNSQNVHTCTNSDSQVCFVRDC